MRRGEETEKKRRERNPPRGKTESGDSEDKDKKRGSGTKGRGAQYGQCYDENISSPAMTIIGSRPFFVCIYNCVSDKIKGI